MQSDLPCDQQTEQLLCVATGHLKAFKLAAHTDEILLTPVPAPRSTQTRSERSRNRAAQAANMGLRPHRKLARNLSSANEQIQAPSAGDRK
jgi:hypothetical protein